MLSFFSPGRTRLGNWLLRQQWIWLLLFCAALFYISSRFPGSILP